MSDEEQPTGGSESREGADPVRCYSLLDRITVLESALEGMVYQFAYSGDNPATLRTGGLSALEEAFGVLGWTDPKPVPDLECDSEGCHKTATCGVPTKDGYKRLCLLHYDIARMHAV